MNRCEYEREFNDSLGPMIHWTLRADVSNAQPPCEVWRNIEERVQAIDLDRAERAARFALLRRLFGHALHLLAESTLSSEAMWSPRNERALLAAHERPTAPWASPWPAFGQMMLIW